MRELKNDQYVSLEANVSRFPFMFFSLSGFIMIHGTKTISCTIRATYEAKTT